MIMLIHAFDRLNYANCEIKPWGQQRMISRLRIGEHVDSFRKERSKN